jgi:hypothetical protein
MTTPTLSTGQPSTLAGYREITAAVFGADSPAVAFLDWKAKQSPNGMDEVVLADEGQMVMVLGHIHLNGFSEEGATDANEPPCV